MENGASTTLVPPTKTDLTIEQKIDHLTGILERHQRLLERQDAVRAVQNLVGKFALVYESCQWEDRLSYLASKTPGLSIEIGGRGVFEGMESARRCLIGIEEVFDQEHAQAMRKAFPEMAQQFEEYEAPAGQFESELIGTPIIEIAEDGKTAKGMWTSLMTLARTSIHDEDPKPKSGWLWWRTAADFIKEDNEWKIWHLVRNPFWFSFYNKDWVEQSMSLPPRPKPGSQMGNHGGGPDKPTTKMYDSYRVEREPRLWPLPPAPYTTFDEKDAYLG